MINEAAPSPISASIKRTMTRNTARSGLIEASAIARRSIRALRIKIRSWLRIQWYCPFQSLRMDSAGLLERSMTRPKRFVMDNNTNPAPDITIAGPIANRRIGTIWSKGISPVFLTEIEFVWKSSYFGKFTHLLFQIWILDMPTISFLDPWIDFLIILDMEIWWKLGAINLSEKIRPSISSMRACKMLKHLRICRLLLSHALRQCKVN